MPVAEPMLTTGGGGVAVGVLVGVRVAVDVGVAVSAKAAGAPPMRAATARLSASDQATASLRLPWPDRIPTDAPIR